MNQWRLERARGLRIGHPRGIGSVKQTDWRFGWREHQQYLYLPSISNLATQQSPLIRSLMGSVSHLTSPHTHTIWLSVKRYGRLVGRKRRAADTDAYTVREASNSTQLSCLSDRR